MSKTHIINYTQMPNLRAIKNRDMKSPVGVRNKYNIGLGHPSFPTDELPAASISETGDQAFDTTIGGMVAFNKALDEGRGEWVPIGAEAALEPSFRGFELDADDEFHYIADTPQALAMGAIEELPGMGDLDTDEIHGGIVNAGENTLTVLINANVTLSTADAEGTGAQISLVKNSAGVDLGNPASVLLIANDREFSCSLSVIVVLQPNDYVSLFLRPDAEATIRTEFVNLTALQIHLDPPL